jgi:hypothetical protein
LFETTQAERARWQLRAAAELTSILGACWDLPVIAWTVGSAGASVFGRVNGLAPAAEVRAAYESWRARLMLTEHSEHARGGAACLRAVACRNWVEVGLTATVFDDEGEGWR